MRRTDLEGSGVQTFLKLPLRGLRLAAILMGAGLVLAAAPVHAGDDDDNDAPDNRAFERKILDNLMNGLGAKRIEDSGIDYRERSPLVVPSKIDLPPPVTGKKALAPNWPKDPDEAERKAALEAANKPIQSIEDAGRPLMPSELATRAPRKTPKAENTTPGTATLMPSELGYTGGLFSNTFGSSSKGEVATFTGEPSRDELTQPPSGYQTPSSSFAYGVGPAGKDPGYTEVYDAATGKTERKRNY